MSLFPLTIVQRSKVLLQALFYLGWIAPLGIIGGIAWGFIDTEASRSVTFLVASGAIALFAYAILTLASFLLVKRGTLEQDGTKGFILKLHSEIITLPFSDIQSIRVVRQIRRLLQPKYWGQYPGATYRIFIVGTTNRYILEWDASWSAGGTPVGGEELVQAFIDAGMPKDRVDIKHKNWFWILGLVFIGALVWFVFFF